MGRNRPKAGGIGAVTYDIFGNVVDESPAAPAAPVAAPAPAPTRKIDTKDPRFKSLSEAEQMLDLILVAQEVNGRQPAYDDQLRNTMQRIEEERSLFNNSVLDAWDTARENERLQYRESLRQQASNPSEVIGSVLDLQRRIPLYRDSPQAATTFLDELRRYPTPTKAALQKLSDAELRTLRSGIESEILSSAYGWAGTIDRVLRSGGRSGVPPQTWDMLTENTNKLLDLRMAIIEAQNGYPPDASKDTKAGRAKKAEIRRTLRELFAEEVVNSARATLDEQNAERRYEGMATERFETGRWREWQKQVRTLLNAAK